jgi:hypothetical protein
MALRQLSLIRGNSRTYTLTVKTATGFPYCLKNWVVFFTVKSNKSLPDAQASIQKIITTFSDSTGGTSGIATISLVPDDTKDLDVGKYDFDIKVVTAASEGFTVMRGMFDLEYNVTQSKGTAGTA